MFSSPYAPPLPLRGHHFLCLLTFAGAGYSSPFKHNLHAVVSALHDGCAARIVAGHDRICHDKRTFFTCPQKENGRCKDDPIARDSLALDDLTRWNIGEKQAWALGAQVRFSPDLVAQMRQAFADNLVRRACCGCSWHNLCSHVAKKNFSSALFFPTAPRKPATAPAKAQQPYGTLGVLKGS